MVASSAEPETTWDSFFCRGLDRLKLATLWALAEAGSEDDRLEQRLDAIRTIPNGDQDPWVDIVPPKMLATLAAIAMMDDNEQASLGESWAQTEELDGWVATDVFNLVRDIGDSADSARLENKTLLLWTSL
ncbi:hypothetical protein KIH39_13650 [Telmatocola sphagniphila]|uniref:Uncharacterized protein n=1 Tax=Telmatocola sphagniphila TaxID=1123043 RepID=A0A8E6ES02_9BACT|nr:hypothetical protein [Telmatocola sphagniphila]QVL29914.1 hypothetical protein KIH39_13650 [Telmatocola sphagniphila]